MNAKIAVVVGLAAILASVFALPQAVFAADVNVSITAGATSKTTDAYSPNPVKANVGDTVIWTNDDTTPHTATSGVPTSGPDGMFGGNAEAGGTILIKGKSESFTFANEGTFPYFCTLHPNMVGSVEVAAGGGPVQIPSSASATLDGNTYEVTAMSTTSKATELEIVPDEKKITVTFDKPGDVELTLPKAMIDGVVASAGVTILETTDTATKVKVVVPEGEPEVDIMGATVVPEFPVIAALILGITVAAIVGYTRIAKGSSTNFFGRA